MIIRIQMYAQIRVSIAASAVLVLLLNAGLVSAQDAGGSAAASSTAAAGQGPQLAEVTVTAERVQTDVQTTPISMAVVSGPSFVAAGVTNLQQLQLVAPDVHITQGQNGSATASIRGVSSSGAAVTLNYDGQYVGTLNGEAYDIARVEVLKGPQGTLYGLNATAGDINVITNAPVIGKFQANGSAEFGNFSELDAQGAVNIPIAGDAAFRLAGSWNNHRGYQTVDNGVPVNYADFHSFRPSFLWTPSDKLRIRLTAEYTYANFGPDQVQGVILQTAPNNTVPPTQPPYSFNPNTLNKNYWSTFEPGENYEYTRLVRGDIEYNFGWATLTLLPNYAYEDSTRFDNYFGTPTLSTEGQTWIYEYISQDELRLNGQTSFGTRWQVGYFYIDTEMPNFTNYYESRTGVNSATVVNTHFDDPHNNELNNAGYGQVTQNITRQLSITAGLRYTVVHQQRSGYDELNLNQAPYTASGGRVIGYTYVANNPGPFDYNRTNWHAGLDYQMTPDHLLYLSSGTSFRDGGFTQINEFLPEDILAYEIGSKNQFLDRRLEANAAIYYYQYRNEQEQAFLPQANGLIAATTLNVGASNLKGAELDLAWLVTTKDRFDFHANYSNAVFLNFSALLTNVNGTSFLDDLDGKHPPSAPPWVLNGDWQHTWGSVGPGQIVSTLNERWTDGYFLDVYNLPAGHVSPYNETDIDLEYQLDHWTVAGWVRNLENRQVLDTANWVYQGRPYYLFGWATPRTYGARISFNY